MNELLIQIQEAVHGRCNQITAAHGDWPCRKGCDDCCRRLASAPRVSAVEWQRIATAIDALPANIAAIVRERIRESASATRPVTCPLLDRESGACLIYDARPIACCAYGFYAERELVLGCERIGAVAAEDTAIIWGNHTALEDHLRELGETAPLAEHLR
ncbi:MAG TPA: YkgJ family cysteine cluster protein [Candidatus Solibacter sp.]|nr:YkgJ family cysteine cluster protein [Candidatus Solibacter sp.]